MNHLYRIIWILACVQLPVVSHAQFIYTIAGTGVAGYNGDSILATSAQLNWPYDVAVDKYNNLYIGDGNNYRIRKIDTNGVITTFAGSGTWGYYGDSIPATDASLVGGFMQFDRFGNLYFYDEYVSSRIRKIDTNGYIFTLAGIGGEGYNGDSIPATTAQISGGGAIAFNSAGDLIFTDQNNYRIRKIDLTSGYIYTIAGNGVSGYSGDGLPATDAMLVEPAGIAIDSIDNIYFEDGSRIRMIDHTDNTIHTIAGTGTAGYNGEGLPATAAQIGPGLLIFDSEHNLYFSDNGYGSASRIRMIKASDDKIYTVVGDGINGYNGEGVVAIDAELFGPDGIRFDKWGHLLIADVDNQRVQIINGPLGVRGSTQPRFAANVRIYPNPVQDWCTIAGISNCEITLYNILGVPILSRDATRENQIQIDLSSLPAGTYWIDAYSSQTWQHRAIEFVKD